MTQGPSFCENLVPPCNWTTKWSRWGLATSFVKWSAKEVPSRWRLGSSFKPHNSARVGKISRCAVRFVLSAPPTNPPAGQWMKKGTRCPPSQMVDFCPNIPALNPRKFPFSAPGPPRPLAVPLSVVNIKMVFSDRPSWSSFFRSSPTLWSRLEIIP